jgi:hypothetical protein
MSNTIKIWALLLALAGISQVISVLAVEQSREALSRESVAQE